MNSIKRKGIIRLGLLAGTDVNDFLLNNEKSRGVIIETIKCYDKIISLNKEMAVKLSKELNFI
jgi:hypothetical protein